MNLLYNFKKNNIFVFDLDNTLIGSDEKEYEGISESMGNLNKQGINLYLATGRSIQSFEGIRDKLNFLKFINSSIICFDGSVIYDLYTKEKIIVNSIEQQLFRECYTKYIDADFVVVALDQIYSNSRRATLLYSQLYRVKSSCINVTNLLENTPSTIINIYMFLKNNKKEYILDFSQEIRVNYIKQVNCFSIFPKNQCKAEALKLILNSKQSSLSNVVAFGDGPNDISMIEKSGIGIAVMNSKPDLIKVAKHNLTCDLGKFLKSINFR
ncbi:hypothetical protein C8Z91_34785 [Paenibacillus elgii]|uniref:Hydrolase n=1 Tax=Paenibacillus elgii TaxID=189691 RepID=A0A2T6FRU3_9BACL|nr:HAD-IIB family hydrolase [Paenibacillus elgii]PUA34634.1 hypothetical protein C8Z91_34785 [Paenibacillus elgii]